MRLCAASGWLSESTDRCEVSCQQKGDKMLFSAIRIVALTILFVMALNYIVPGIEANLLEAAEGMFP